MLHEIVATLNNDVKNIINLVLPKAQKISDEFFNSSEFNLYNWRSTNILIIGMGVLGILMNV